MLVAYLEQVMHSKKVQYKVCHVCIRSFIGLFGFPPLCSAGRECGEQPEVAGAVPVRAEAGAVQPPGAALVLPARHLRLAGLLLHPVRGLSRLGSGLPDHGGRRLVVGLVYGNHGGQRRRLQTLSVLHFRPVASLYIHDIHSHSALTFVVLLFALVRNTTGLFEVITVLLLIIVPFLCKSHRALGQYTADRITRRLILID